MVRTPLNLTDANLQIESLVGLTVSLPWKGYGSAIFLELGVLSPIQHPRQHHKQGEACISIEWDWRIEEGSKVVCGSSNSRPTIKREVEALCGETIEELSIHGEVPELLIHFSGGKRLISAAMLAGYPRWSIRLSSETWMACDEGVIHVGDGEETGITPEEKAVFDHAEITAERWGIPVAASVEGKCEQCECFISIDGDGHLLDYGVCTSRESPLDGRAVHLKSCCAAFSSIAD